MRYKSIEEHTRRMLADLFVKDVEMDIKTEKFMKKQFKKAEKEAMKVKEDPQVIEKVEEPMQVDTEGSDLKMESAVKKPNKIEENKKTVFVGNVALSMTKDNSKLKQFFGKCGEIESIRFRSIPRKRLLKRADALKHKQFNDDRKTCNAYIIFVQLESVALALQLNGEEFEGHMLRVDNALQRKQDSGVFVGNLPAEIEEIDLHQHFKDCGEIDYVRCVRDRQMNLGKGIAYVVYKDVTSIRLALRLDNSLLKNRKIRVKKIENNPSKRRIEAKDVAKRLKKLKKNQKVK